MREVSPPRDRLRQAVRHPSLSPARRGPVRPHRALGQSVGPAGHFLALDLQGQHHHLVRQDGGEPHRRSRPIPARVFSWLICESYDDKGNVIVYEYKPEDSDGVDLTQAHERNRTDTTRSANRYLKRVFYGNRTPYFPTLTAERAGSSARRDWCFELVFDYGEHDLHGSGSAGDRQALGLPARSVLHLPVHIRGPHLPAVPAGADVSSFPGGAQTSGTDCLVRSTDFTHTPASNRRRIPASPSILSCCRPPRPVTGATPTGGYLSKSLPPLEFEYTQATIDETVRDVDPESLENLPYGLDGTHYRWVDLDGEGLSGILTEQAGSWFYKPT